MTAGSLQRAVCHRIEVCDKAETLPEVITEQHHTADLCQLLLWCPVLMAHIGQPVHPVHTAHKIHAACSSNLQDCK